MIEVYKKKAPQSAYGYPQLTLNNLSPVSIASFEKHGS